MRRALAAALTLATWSAQAQVSLLYASSAQWRAAAANEKAEAARDFMARFCGDPTMTPERLIACLDAGEADFAAALACVSG